MKTISLEAERTFRQYKSDEPEGPAAGEALIQIHNIGICGTDYSAYLGKFPFLTFPTILGHELGVEVLEVGEGVTNVKPGDKCSVEPYMNCGECVACRQGKTNCCANNKVIGVHIDGGMREKILIRADKLHKSDKLTFDQLALVETLVIGCHAVNRAQIKKNEPVLIIGAGPIGLGALEFCKVASARPIMLDMNENRLDFCRNVIGGVETISLSDHSENEVRELTNGDLASVVIDATGHAGSMANALSYVAHTGRLIFLGVTSDQITFYPKDMHLKEASIMSSRNGVSAEFGQVIAAIESGHINTDNWISHRVEFDNLIEKFDSFLDPKSNVIKAVIESI